MPLIRPARNFKYKVEEKSDGNRIKIIIAGLNQKFISEGSLASLVFTRSDLKNPGRIRPLDIVAANQLGVQVNAGWRDRQRWDRTNSRVTITSCPSVIFWEERERFFTRDPTSKKSTFYIKRIYQEENQKKWDFIPVAQGLSGDISDSFNISEDQIRGRMLIQVFRSGADCELETNLIDSEEIIINTTAHK